MANNRREDHQSQLNAYGELYACDNCSWDFAGSSIRALAMAEHIEGLPNCPECKVGNLKAVELCS